MNGKYLFPQLTFVFNNKKDVIKTFNKVPGRRGPDIFKMEHIQTHTCTIDTNRAKAHRKVMQW